MAGRPGASIGGERDLHFLLLADCSGSMANDGRIQALNVAIKEALPHLRAAAAENPHARLLFRAVAFSSGARWHIETPTPIEEVRWQDLTAGGYTDLGEALRLVVGAFSDPRMAAHILPPAIVLISDGRPTDDYLGELRTLMDHPIGASAVRVAVAIGRDADLKALEEFQSPEVGDPVRVENPEQLAAYLRWASVAATFVASEPARHFGPAPWQPFDQGRLVW